MNMEGYFSRIFCTYIYCQNIRYFFPASAVLKTWFTRTNKTPLFLDVSWPKVGSLQRSSSYNNYNKAEEAEKARMRDLARQQELEKQVYAQLMSGRDRGEPSAREAQAAMERATQVDTFGDRRGEVQAAMRDVGYGGSNWT